MLTTLKMAIKRIELMHGMILSGQNAKHAHGMSIYMDLIMLQELQ